MPGPPPRPNSALVRGAPVEPPRPSGGHLTPGSGSGPHAKHEPPQGTFFLGRYRVVEEIGVGGMASVHLARMDGPGGFQKWVAIKRIHPNLVEDDQFVDMFLDEARIAAGINHANVAQVFDLGKDDGTYWIAMEYLHGEPLRELMRRCEDRAHLVSPDIAARICAEACEGLHAAHELRGTNGQLLGLVHRDVTPHNLFITYEGTTKVVDFGIAKVADRLSETRAGTLKGKLAYMSPEQVRGQDDVDRTTDIFALGVVLWELTTGHRLFRMDTDLDTLEKVQACVVPPPSTVLAGYPIELESVVMRALAKKKSDRFQTAREFARALNVYLQRRAVLVGPEEVSAFMHALFSDRIRAREAHLAWAADVTSTINVQQLQAMKAARGLGGKDEVSLASVSEADIGRPSLPGPANPGVQPLPPKTGALPPLPAPPPAAGRPALPLPTPPPNPERPPTSTGFPAPRVTGLAAQSLLDDDEDIPTTVASREQEEELYDNDQRTAAFIAPSQQAPAIRGPAPPPAAGMRTAPAPTTPLRATTMGLGPAGYGPGAQPAPAHLFGAPPSGAPASSRPAPSFGAPPSGIAPAPSLGATLPPMSLPGARPGATVPLTAGQLAPPGGLFTTGSHPLAPSTNMPPMAPVPGGMPLAGGAPGNFGPPTGLRPSQVETALSLPRPDANALWAAQQVALRNTEKKSTAVLVAVAVLTAICVIVLGFLYYYRFVNPDPASQVAPRGPERTTMSARDAHDSRA